MQKAFQIAAQDDDITRFFKEAINAAAALPLPKPMIYAELGVIGIVGGLYTSEEREFLVRMCEKFERVHLGFSYFGLIASGRRPIEAMRLSNMQSRSGWIRVGVPRGFLQTVEDHQLSGYMLGHILFQDDPMVKDICQMFRYHDMGESVMGDFTPHCQITKAEKAKLEDMAMRLITASARRGHPLPEIMKRCFDIFEGIVPDAAEIRSKAKDIDLLEMILEVTLIRYHCPWNEKDKINKALAEFDAYVPEKLVHPRAKAFCAGLQDPAVFGMHPSIVFAKAADNMRRADPVYAAFCDGFDWRKVPTPRPGFIR